MSHADANEFIRARFLAEIHAPQDIVIAYGNDVPRDKDGDAVEDVGTNTDLWARLSIKPIPSIQVERGTPGRYKNPGLIILQCFVPLHSGTKALYDLADTVTTAFRSTVRDGIIYSKVDIEEAARESGAWWQLNITIPYSFYS